MFSRPPPVTRPFSLPSPVTELDYLTRPPPRKFCYMHPSNMEFARIFAPGQTLPVPEYLKTTAIRDYANLRVHDVSFRDYTNDRQGCRICITCQHGPIQGMNAAQTLDHAHHSELELFRNNGIDPFTGEFDCMSCIDTPHLAYFGKRITLLVNTSTIANWKTFEAEWRGDMAHVFNITMPGATFRRITHMLNIEIRGFRQPFVIYICAGLNDLDQIQSGDHHQSIIRNIDLLIKTVKDIDHRNLVLFIKPCPSPKLTKFRKDTYSFDEQQYKDKTKAYFKVLDKMDSVNAEQDLSDTNITLESIPGLHHTGTKAGTTRNLEMINELSGVYGRNTNTYVTHKHQKSLWRPSEVNDDSDNWHWRVMHLKNKVIYQNGIRINRKLMEGLGLSLDNIYTREPDANVDGIDFAKDYIRPAFDNSDLISENVDPPDMNIIMEDAATPMEQELETSPEDHEAIMQAMYDDLELHPDLDDTAEYNPHLNAELDYSFEEADDVMPELVQDDDGDWESISSGDSNDSGIKLNDTPPNMNHQQLLPHQMAVLINEAILEANIDMPPYVLNQVDVVDAPEDAEEAEVIMEEMMHSPEHNPSPPPVPLPPFAPLPVPARIDDWDHIKTKNIMEHIKTLDAGWIYRIKPLEREYKYKHNYGITYAHIVEKYGEEAYKFGKSPDVVIAQVRCVKRLVDVTIYNLHTATSGELMDATIIKCAINARILELDTSAIILEDIAFHATNSDISEQCFARTVKLARSYRLVFIPICANTHWTLVLVDNRTKKVFHMNSIQAREDNLQPKTCLINLKPVIREFCFQNKADFEYIQVVQGPLQRNRVDCGAYVVKYAWNCLEGSLGNDINKYNDDYMQQIRINMIDIINSPRHLERELFLDIIEDNANS